MGVWYAQEYGFYDRLDPAGVTLTVMAQGKPVPLAAREVQAIDADSSPIRWRACFRLTGALPERTHGAFRRARQDECRSRSWPTPTEGASVGLLDNAGQFLNSEQGEQMSDQAIQSGSDAVNDATGGKFSDQVTQAGQLADDRIGTSEQAEQNPNQP